MSLIEQRGDLRAAQREPLAAALTLKGSANDIIALIEKPFAAAPARGHCKSEDIRAWAIGPPFGRYMCNACHRTSNALTGKPLAQLLKRDAWPACVRALVDRVSLRTAAKRANVGLETSFRWRHRIVASAQDKRVSVAMGIVDADETFILKSEKCTRWITVRRLRKRGSKAKSPDFRPTSMRRS